MGRVRGEGLRVVEGQRARVQVREPPGGDRGRRLVVGREVGYPRRGRGRGRGQGGAGGRVVGRQEEVEAAGVEGGEAPGPHHQHVLGVVVEGGDAGRHADGEGEPGHAGGGWGGGSGGNWWRGWRGPLAWVHHHTVKKIQPTVNCKQKAA